MIHLEAILPDTVNGQRMDLALSTVFSEYSRARIKSWIQAGQVLVDGRVPGVRDPAVAGAMVVCEVPELAVETVQPQAIPLNVVFEDEQIIVINKPAALVMHPAAGNPDGTVQNALLHHFPELDQIPRSGIVHRLDKDTTGLFVVARTLTAHHSLVEQLQSRTMGRQYCAIVNGALVAGGTVEEPIGRHAQDRKRMAVRDDGKPATTHYRIRERFERHTALNVNLETGRTHQIRVHLAHRAHPLVGDSVYGLRARIPKRTEAGLQHDESLAAQSRIAAFKRQALHAQVLRLQHPSSQQALSWEAALPDDMEQLLADLRVL